MSKTLRSSLCSNRIVIEPEFHGDCRQLFNSANTSQGVLRETTLALGPHTRDAKMRGNSREERISEAINVLAALHLD